MQTYPLVLTLTGHFKITSTNMTFKLKVLLSFFLFLSYLEDELFYST